MLKRKETYIVRSDDNETVLAIVTVAQGLNPHRNVMVNDQTWKVSLSETYKTTPDNVLVQSEIDQQNQIYRCVVCQENPVDALGGYDTCPDCIGKI
jgi:hypothetical protein